MHQRVTPSAWAWRPGTGRADKQDTKSYWLDSMVASKDTGIPEASFGFKENIFEQVNLNETQLELAHAIIQHY